MLKDLLIKNRSIRSFDKSVRLSEDQLLEMIECTRFCPSSANLQSMKFAIVCDMAKCDEIFKATKWAGYLKDMEIPPKGCEPAAYIVVCNDKNIAPNTTPFFKDCGIVSHTILLRACEMGFGGCMIGSFDREMITKSLSLPEEYEITLVLAIGKAMEEPVIVENSGDIKYYREENVHYVPKRSLDEIVIK